MIQLLDNHKRMLTDHVTAGACVADFTCGNGHDTLWLSRAVGENGRVFAFDIQQQALDNTAALLAREGAPDNVRLIADSHSNCALYIDRPLAAGMFNLGYLPGADKSVTTRRETTLPAVKAAIDLLCVGGMLLVAVYPGHPEGRAEGELLQEYFSTLPRKAYTVCCMRMVNSPDSPFFFTIEKLQNGR